MTKRTKYKIETIHPNGYMNGEHEVEVTTSKNHQTNRYTKSVSGKGFGCSRDYETPIDSIAIQNLLAENGMRMVKIIKI